MIVSLEAYGTNAYNRYAMSPAGQTPEESWWTYQPKRCGNNNNNKDEDNCPKTFNDKNHQASSQKFWQLTLRVRKKMTTLKCDRW